MPGVLPVLAIDTSHGLEPQWYVMPLAVGLADHLDQASTLQEIVAPFLDLADTLAALAEHRVFHRDIKPDNLFWHAGRAVLADFGIAYWGQAGPTKPVEKIGPMGFLAPEMFTAGGLSGEIGSKADVYSLAQTLFVAARREGPYPPGGTLWSSADEFHLPNWQNPRTKNGSPMSTLLRVLQAATRIDPAARLTMAEFARQLRSWLELMDRVQLTETQPHAMRLTRWGTTREAQFLLTSERRAGGEVFHMASKVAQHLGVRTPGVTGSRGPFLERASWRNWLGSYDWPVDDPETYFSDDSGPLRPTGHSTTLIEDQAGTTRVVLAAVAVRNDASFFAEIHTLRDGEWALEWQSGYSPWSAPGLPWARQIVDGLAQSAMGRLPGVPRPGRRVGIAPGTARRPVPSDPSRLPIEHDV
ncbi:protein kinase domain-containing protein [Streptomyces sp. TLI_171]|uniref:protein kinase domain-containing protein n=1 Tax=Streptomyces sp. TLI_171 TaxID=1938859 RepID=UPI000C17D27C|nr:protein kinase [Streptomyces sp. TLI_171]RKE22031.1 protein kinase-like protein [Streptomyces sp. TLI_171]